MTGYVPKSFFQFHLSENVKINENEEILVHIDAVKSRN